MHTRQLPRALLALVCGAGLIVLAVHHPERTRGDGDVLLGPAADLPDLDQETPSRLTVYRTEDRSWVVGFTSAIRNTGDGPLVLEGNRVQAGGPTMEVDQLVGGDERTYRIPAVGEIAYVRSPDHAHWHYRGFDRYELRAAGSGATVARDRKTGFCLGDRYRVDSRVVTGAAPQPAFTDNCAPGEPDVTHLVEGISVGYGDVYQAHLEYQELPLDGLADGRYVLVHTADPDHALQESTYANNAASVLLRLQWESGRPHLTVLASCPDTDRCDQRVRARTVATGLEVPWDLAFLPDGSALVTERPGRVRLLGRRGQLRPRPVATVDVSSRGEGGLLGLATDPDFDTNGAVYLYYTAADSMRLERWHWTGTRLVRETTLLDQVAAGAVHDSGRIRFGPDHWLYVATGDAGDPRLAQAPDSLNGKILALSPDQYHGAGVVRPTVVATGLRNPQGFDWQPGTGLFVTNDHGPSGFDGPEGYDEVDVVVAGGNYGWPDAISDDTGDGRFLPPARIYLQPIAPSGGAFLTAPGTAWQGQYVLAALRGEQLRRLTFDGERVVADEPFLEGRFGRLRSVTEGPDGSLYVLTSNRDGRGTPARGDDRIIRVRIPRS